MNVLLVRPERVGEESSQSRMRIKHVPLGLLYLASMLKREGHAVRITDEIVGDEVEQAIRDHQPDLLGITCTTPLWDRARKIVELGKRYGVKVVVGGPHPSVLPEQCLDDADLDAVVMGEGEETIVDLCRVDSQKWASVPGLVLPNGGPVRTAARSGPPDLDAIPFPDYSLLDRKKYMGDDELGFYVKKTENLIRIFTSRGCPFHCTYCSSHSMFGRSLRLRSAANVVEELVYQSRLWKTRNVCFMDDIFTINQERVREVCDAIRASGIDFRWSCFSRVGLEEATVREMAAAGCILIGYGVETGSEKILKRIKKATTLDQARDTFRLSRRFGIRCKAFFMIGLPDETREEFNETVEFAKELDADYIMLSVFMPLPGSEEFDKANPIDYAHHSTKSYFHTTDPELRRRQLEFLNRVLFRFAFAKTLWRNFSIRHLPYYLSLFRHYLAVRTASA